MAVISPYVFFQELDNNGNPLAGGKVYTYEAGTSTPKTTYTDSTEGTANTNPVILDANGRADIWLDTGAYKFVLTDSGDNTIKTVDNVLGGSENVFGNAVDDIATNYTVVSGDEGAIKNATASLTVNLLASATAGEGFVLGVKNSSSGNVTIDPDGLELIDGNSTLTLYPNQSVLVVCTGTAWLSLYQDLIALGADNTFTGDNTFSGTTTFSGDVVMSSSQVQEVKGADIASAAALPTPTDGNFYDVTGTTTITSIDTSGTIGTEVTYQFDDALILTHNATDLILPTGANITTAAGDVFKFREYASGDWVCVGYTLASGEALSTSAITLGTMQTAAGTETEIDFTSIPSGVKRITVNIVDLSTNGTDQIYLQIGDSGGLETTGYKGLTQGDGILGSNFSSAFVILVSIDAAGTYHAKVVLDLVDSSTNLWSADGGAARSDSTGNANQYFNGSKALSATLDRLRITTSGGTNTFDSGSKFNISYEF